MAKTKIIRRLSFYFRDDKATSFTLEPEDAFEVLGDYYYLTGMINKSKWEVRVHKEHLLYVRAQWLTVDIEEKPTVALPKEPLREEIDLI